MHFLFHLWNNQHVFLWFFQKPSPSSFLYHLSPSLSKDVWKRARWEIDQRWRSFLVAPQIAPFSIGDEPANWGEQVSAICSIVKGDSPIDIQWSLNGEPITARTHPDITIQKTGKKTSLLTIDSVTAHHAGEYSCVASNLVGSVTRSAVLSVNGIWKALQQQQR